MLSALHQRFPQLFTIPLIAALQASLQAPSKASLSALPPEQRDKEENARILRQRSLLRIYSELELVGIVTTQSLEIGEATYTVFKDLVSLSWRSVRMRRVQLMYKAVAVLCLHAMPFVAHCRQGNYRDVHSPGCSLYETPRSHLST